ncbi:hypothetical protein LPW11_10965 [Geomonas sp. RF6]|uniref:hypothetical protein n=1 Tax=Geomonas sp. RF6 TaxID=2897342 RepID=UPI001E2C907D|nr:hypothetical protein [Geomonas sp. RF6]UFS72694.1 hypothetical protein LPW11_10965 [Geomonas sp. RF6]
MILVVSAYPDESIEADGAMERIAIVDMVLAGHSRAYLDISLKGHIFPEWEEVSPGVIVHRVNLFLHFWYILSIAAKASMVYVHSVPNALRVLPLYLSFPIVTDLSLTGGAADGGPLWKLAQLVAHHKSKALVLDVGAEVPRVAGLRMFRAAEPASKESKALAAFVTKDEPEVKPAHPVR